jgi:hypothetical protein
MNRAQELAWATLLFHVKNVERRIGGSLELEMPLAKFKETLPSTRQIDAVSAIILKVARKVNHA